MNGDGAMEKHCRDIYSELSTLLSWKWDDRFKVILAEFTVENAEKVSSVLAKGFESKWEEKTIKAAPPPVKKIADILCGLQASQQLFTYTHDPKTVLFAAWWPWGNNQRISVRIGICYQNKMLMPDTELESDFKKWFDIK